MHGAWAFILAAIGVCAAVGPSPIHARAQDPGPEVRALWVVRTSLTSPRAIDEMVRRAADAGFNTILVQVRGRGDAYYTSSLEPRADALDRQPASFDPLANTIAAAHAANVKVHAWVSVDLVGSAVTVSRNPRHIVNQHPEWLMVPRALAASLAKRKPGDAAYVEAIARWTRAEQGELEGLYASPIPRASADHVVAVVRELVTRYVALDGVHLDYVRYPRDDFDYSAAALAAFRADAAPTLRDVDRRALDRRAMTDVFAWVDAHPDRWRAFRRDRLTALVSAIRSVTNQQRPAMLLSAAVRPDPQEAAAQRFQDWRAWVARGLLDVVCPMAYGTDVESFGAQIEAARAGAGGRPLWAGIGAYRLTSPQTVEHIDAARRMGARGVALFSYDSLVEVPESDRLAEIGRGAFGRDARGRAGNR